jgi:N-acetylmuramoyl-L-alanine amidase
VQPPAQDGNILIFTVGNIQYLLNGIAYNAVGVPFIDPATDRMMIPLRSLAEATGLDVDWDSATRSVYIYLPSGQTLVLPADQPLPGGMGMPMIVNDRVYIPLRYIMEVLGFAVEWDSANRAAIITW